MRWAWAGTTAASSSAASRVPLQEMPAGFWPAITRRAAASSVASIALAMGAPCVLASLRARAQKLGNIPEGALDGDFRRDPLGQRFGDAAADIRRALQQRGKVALRDHEDADVGRRRDRRGARHLRHERDLAE